MKRTFSLLLAALVILALSVSLAEAATSAEVQPVKPVTGLFELRAKALLEPPPIGPADRLIPFMGRGRAWAGRCVVVRLGTLCSPVIPARARVEFEPLCRYGPALQYFRGRGKAEVSVFGLTLRFHLACHGEIRRTPTGAYMTARFAAVLTSAKPPHFRGAFAGPKVFCSSSTEAAK